MNFSSNYLVIILKLFLQLGVAPDLGDADNVLQLGNLATSRRRSESSAAADEFDLRGSLSPSSTGKNPRQQSPGRAGSLGMRTPEQSPMRGAGSMSFSGAVGASMVSMGRLSHIMHLRDSGACRILLLVFRRCFLLCRLLCRCASCGG